MRQALRMVTLISKELALGSAIRSMPEVSKLSCFGRMRLPNWLPFSLDPGDVRGTRGLPAEAAVGPASAPFPGVRHARLDLAHRFDLHSLPPRTRCGPRRRQGEGGQIAERLAEPHRLPPGVLLRSAGFGDRAAGDGRRDRRCRAASSAAARRKAANRARCPSGGTRGRWPIFGRGRRHVANTGPGTATRSFARSRRIAWASRFSATPFGGGSCRRARFWGRRGCGR
jgi:hypothetical protein